MTLCATERTVVPLIPVIMRRKELATYKLIQKYFQSKKVGAVPKVARGVGDQRSAIQFHIVKL